MRALLALLLLLLSTAFANAQQRTATVQLDDGRQIAGKVVAMDLTSLQLEVEGQVVVLETGHITSCRFDGGAKPVPTVEPTSAPGELSGKSAPKVRPTQLIAEPPEVLQAAEMDPDAAPHDIRHRSLLRSRIEDLDAAYPWLCPAAPSQWWSIGMLLFAVTTLFVYLSVRVCGAEQASLGLSMLVTLWYMGTGFVQVAMVPASDFATAAMLVGNSAFALFWLRLLFGLPRSSAVLALAVQLGFLLLGFGVLQLADSVLRSIGSAHA